MRTATSDLFLESILERIQFRILETHIPGSLFDSYTPDESFHAFDLANTQIWDRSCALMNLDFLRIPRLSTIAIGYIINQLVKGMKREHKFVNVGVWHGFSLLAGIVGNQDKECIGIDNFSDPIDTRNPFFAQFERFKGPKSAFHAMDYENYFREIHQGSIGVYFYDGAHSYEHQHKGLLIADPYLAPGSYVLVDDTNDPEPRAATLDFLARQRNRYSLVLDKPTANNGHPTYWNGLMVLRKDH